MAAYSAEPPAPQPAAARPAALVAGQPISTAEVEEAASVLLAGRQVPPEVRSLALAQSLEVLIDGRLVAVALLQQGLTASDAEIDGQLAALEKTLATQGQVLADWLESRHLSREEVRRRLARTVLVEKYLAAQSTDQALEQFFDAHRAQFDGSRQHLRQILLRVDGPTTTAALRRLVAQAEQIRQQIAGKQMTFAEAAARYSAGPSRRRGGDLGFVDRQSPLIEPFLTAALALAPGQLSPPVVTPLGVHLIECLESQPGQRRWSEVREQLLPRFRETLVRQLAQAARGQTQIEYTGAIPHYRPGTRELVPAQP